MPAHDRLAAALRAAAERLLDQRGVRDLDETLTQIVAAAVDLVPAADAGGISMVERGFVTSRNPTAAGVGELDQLQSELHEGPCISALDDPAEDGVVLVDDLHGDDAARWPRFSPHAVDAGFRSVLSLQLRSSRGVRAALNLYATGSHAFDDEARQIAALFALQATMLIFGTVAVEQLHRAVESRDIIGQAKGILIERHHVDDAEAFQMLVNASQETNIKLVELARSLVDETIGQRGLT
jgi:hypothetical protein